MKKRSLYPLFLLVTFILLVVFANALGWVFYLLGTAWYVCYLFYSERFRG